MPRKFDKTKWKIHRPPRPGAAHSSIFGFDENGCKFHKGVCRKEVKSVKLVLNSMQNPMLMMMPKAFWKCISLSGQVIIKQRVFKELKVPFKVKGYVSFVATMTHYTFEVIKSFTVTDKLRSNTISRIDWEETRCTIPIYQLLAGLRNKCINCKRCDKKISFV